MPWGVISITKGALEGWLKNKFEKEINFNINIGAGGPGRGGAEGGGRRGEGRGGLPTNIICL